LIRIRARGCKQFIVNRPLDFCLNASHSFYIMARDAVIAEGPAPQLNDDIVKQHLTV
jgi:ABC-type branched-subunit amino acid transport system ATPase component